MPQVAQRLQAPPRQRAALVDAPPHAQAPPRCQQAPPLCPQAPPLCPQAPPHCPQAPPDAHRPRRMHSPARRRVPHRPPSPRERRPTPGWHHGELQRHRKDSKTSCPWSRSPGSPAPPGERLPKPGPASREPGEPRCHQDEAMLEPRDRVRSSHLKVASANDLTHPRTSKGTNLTKAKEDRNTQMEIL